VGLLGTAAGSARNAHRQCRQMPRHRGDACAVWQVAPGCNYCRIAGHDSRQCPERVQLRHRNHIESHRTARRPAHAQPGIPEAATALRARQHAESVRRLPNAGASKRHMPAGLRYLWGYWAQQPAVPAAHTDKSEGMWRLRAAGASKRHVFAAHTDDAEGMWRLRATGPSKRHVPAGLRYLWSCWAQQWAMPAAHTDDGAEGMWRLRATGPSKRDVPAAHTDDGAEGMWRLRAAGPSKRDVPAGLRFLWRCWAQQRTVPAACTNAEGLRHLPHAGSSP